MNKTEAKKLLTVGNFKLGGNIASWDLPATQEVCGRVCDGCYAVNAQRIYPHALPSRERKLAFSKTDAFVPSIIGAINILKPAQVRIHSAGEMYSQEYIDKWVKIGELLPKQTFYTYTKRLAEFDFTKLKELPNVVVIDSLHGGKINYGGIDKCPSGMMLCPDHKGSEERKIIPKGPICGVVCSYCFTKTAEKTGVYFVKH